MTTEKTPDSSVLSDEIEKLSHQIDETLTKLAGEQCGFALVVVTTSGPKFASNIKTSGLVTLFEICSEVAAQRLALDESNG